MGAQAILDSTLRSTDPQVAELIDAEIERQSQTICLIPSENHVSAAVLAALGSVFTNKYSEGYPGRRYYEGQQAVDPLEELAIELLKELGEADADPDDLISNHESVDWQAAADGDVAELIRLCVVCWLPRLS